LWALWQWVSLATAAAYREAVNAAAERPEESLKQLERKEKRA